MKLHWELDIEKYINDSSNRVLFYEGNTNVYTTNFTFKYEVKKCFKQKIQIRVCIKEDVVKKVCFFF